MSDKTKAFFSNFPIDKVLFPMACVLSVIGVLFSFSSQYPDFSNGALYLKQIISFIIALGGYFLFARLDYQSYSSYSIVVYIIGLVLLLLVVIFGKTVNGSTSWINLGFFHAQLSEFVKLIYIVIFATFIVRFQDNLSSLSFFFIAGMVLVPYLVLILLQPDLGTAVIFVAIFVIMFFISGGNSTVLLVLPPIGILSIVFPFIGYMSEFVHPNFLANFFWQIKGYIIMAGVLIAFSVFMFILYRVFLRKFLLVSFIIGCILIASIFGSLSLKYLFKNYHYERIAIVFNPSIDPMGKGYNINQSFISIGSGGLFGTGLTKGLQNRGNFLPAESTDFIIALVGEEWGFAGIVFVVMLNVFFIYTLVQRANEARNFLGFLITMGVCALLSTHFIINILSAIGFLPVIGIPLPFVSYGGSSLLTNFCALGIIYNINHSRYSFKN